MMSYLIIPELMALLTTAKHFCNHQSSTTLHECVVFGANVTGPPQHTEHDGDLHKTDAYTSDAS